MEDIYIELLRYGKEHLADGVTFGETRSYLQELRPEAHLVQSDRELYDTFNELFNNMSSQGSDRYGLSMEGYFHLLDHDELQEARKSSRNALRVAIGAIIISAILAAASIALQLPWARLVAPFK